MQKHIVRVLSLQKHWGTGDLEGERTNTQPLCI